VPRLWPAGDVRSRAGMRAAVAAALFWAAVSALALPSEALDVTFFSCTDDEPQHSGNSHTAAVNRASAADGGSNTTVVPVRHSSSSSAELLTEEQQCIMGWVGVFSVLCVVACAVNCAHSLQMGPFSAPDAPSKVMTSSNPSSASTFETEG
jgi:hypothetical protein